MIGDHATWEGGGNGVEAGLMELNNLMKTGRFKVFGHLKEVFEEIRYYHRHNKRGEDGTVRSVTVKVNDDFIELLDDYAENYQDLSDRMAVNLLNDYLDNELDRVAAKKGFIEDFIEILPPQKVAIFFQIENKMDAVIKADLAMAIPLIESKTAKK